MRALKLKDEERDILVTQTGVNENKEHDRKVSHLNDIYILYTMYISTNTEKIKWRRQTTETKGYGRGFEYVSEDLRVEETQGNVLHLIKPRKIRIEPKTRPIVCKQVSE